MLDVLLDSWDRQCQIIDNLFDLVNEENKSQKPSDDGMPIVEQFAHIHNTRRFWLSQTDPSFLEGYGKSYVQVSDDDWQPVQDLSQLRDLLRHSAKAVRNATKKAIDAGKIQFGGYDHPIYFLQHMVWHEGYHFALIMLALRLAGNEPSEEWEEQNVWGLWRVEE
ncbi:MAG TPA: DinB family protein [Fimbriimonadaceae bacterium]|nr:DinB family protein [Fimbriimonadaceae bacterium]